jgi:hypothetical protein
LIGVVILEYISWTSSSKVSSTDLYLVNIIIVLVYYNDMQYILYFSFFLLL